MTTGKIFISHTTQDDAFVQALRQKLEAHGLPTWVDSRELVGGDRLAPEIERALEDARACLVVVSLNIFNSAWVKKEVDKALAVAQTRGDSYRVIPVLLPGVAPYALGFLWQDQPLGVRVELGPGTLDEALPALLAALGERLPEDPQPSRAVPALPVEELILRLQDPQIEEVDGTPRATATATLLYEPADPTMRPVESARYRFAAPLGAIEHEELRWYIEEFFRWPTELFRERAARTEAQFPAWGQALFEAATGARAARAPLEAWARGEGERRFSIWVDADPPEGASAEAAHALAASSLQALPWELLHDGHRFLFRGHHPVRVRRRLPNREPMTPALAQLPIRVLLVSPRPEDKYAGYIDHRSSALPLVEAVEHLGDVVTLTVLDPPTFPALQAALRQAMAAGEPFDVVHFDGHGVFDRKYGLGALVFEDPQDAGKMTGRASLLVDAQTFAETLHAYRTPLVFLDACQSAQFAEDPSASVAARLLEAGVTSVIAMTHTVLVATSARFVRAFYQALAEGQRVGQAMLRGQQALDADTFRLNIMGAGALRLQDWFVPVLYQEAQDPQLFTRLPPDSVRELGAQRHRLAQGALPAPPPHTFIGRSRDLLILERLLMRENPGYAVVIGTGGAGKTTLTVELARWLLRTRRFARVAFVSLETLTDPRAVLDALGRQLLPEGEKYSVAHYATLKEALLPVERALRDAATLIVVDNVETILTPLTPQPPLPPTSGGEGESDSPSPFPLISSSPPSPAPILNLLLTLLPPSPRTRLLFTSREILPAPFDHLNQHVRLTGLATREAVELVSRVMAQEGVEPPAHDPGGTPEEVEALVDAVGRHPRALVLLARETARRGVRVTTDTVGDIFAALERKHPGERENSLYASVELSLRRMTGDGRQKIGFLGAFHGGASLIALAPFFDLDDDTAERLHHELIEVGLAEEMQYRYLRLDPALPAYLWAQMDETARADARARWGEAMTALIGFLYQQQFKDAHLAAHLTLLELPNLLAALAWIETTQPPEGIVDLAGSVEQLLAALDRPRALAEAVAVRERAAKRLGAWGSAQYEAEMNRIERLMGTGHLQDALDSTKKILLQCLTAGETAYPGAAHDIARAYFRLGRVLSRGGAAGAALEPLAESQRRFQALADAGNQNAAVMASVAITESGDCFSNLGRYDEAVVAYEEAIRRKGKLNDTRGVAVNKGQLGTVRLLQRRYPDALAAWEEARGIFETLNEPEGMATAWHQIGMVHKNAGNADAAERAYRQALAIEVARGDRQGQASSLGELGNLYHGTGRPEEAVAFYRQVADIYTEMKDLRYEGVTRSNIANALLPLQRYDEARRELLRAIECKQPFGHAAEPWKTWDILHDLENATGHPEAAAQARERAIQTYFEYRREGGENTSGMKDIYEGVSQLISSGNTNEFSVFSNQLEELLNQEIPGYVRVTIPKLQAILQGRRDPALANDPALDYDDAAEIRLLLERLKGVS